MTNDQDSRLRLRSSSRVRAYLELIRLPNLFTAAADVAMGFLFVQTITGSTDAWTLALLVGASSLLYASGVVLNDVFDFQFDARYRGERPLPSGRISRGAAAWLGGELLVLGVAVAWLAASRVGHFGPGIVAGLLAACIVLYDAYAKQTPLGPVVMGACRMLNVLLGMSVAAAPWHAEHWIVAGGIGTYILGVTWFARTEARGSNRGQLGLATVVMMLGIALLAWFPSFTGHLGPMLLRRWQLLMTILGLLIGWRCFRAVIDPIPPRVQMAVKHSILSLVILDAAVCLVVAGMFPALMILLLLAPAMLLGRWFHST